MKITARSYGQRPGMPRVARPVTAHGPRTVKGPDDVRALHQLAEDRGFEPLRVINPTRFPIVRTRPLCESSAKEDTGADGPAGPRPVPL
ncbi:hypothetical protein BN10_1480002 [Phycicoccus elongatus Lp2]|uniref:Uncharacterized protein n=1 Tax=Phycicoccus elongatus Lp2 TaxID=1193181 RepID=N0DYE9_9MICO|nr:hypothetical protein BN10_1480002 [Phycicoccus elongatus Lp2]